MQRTMIWAVLLVGALGCGGEAAPEPAEQSVAEAPVKAAEEAPAPEEPEVDPAAEEEARREARRKAPESVGSAPADAQKSKSGLKWKVLEPGTGTVKPSRDDRVWIHYTSWSSNGKTTSSTWRQGVPQLKKMKKLVAGWKEAVSDMVVGERRLLWIPAKLAHAKRKKTDSVRDRRVLDIELMKLKVAPSAPANVKRAPKSAQKTRSGVAFVTLVEGKGGKTPRANSVVKVRYAGWTQDGRCFDFTGPDETTSFALHEVIPGWTEGLQVMSEGDTARFWIPQKVAYNGQSGKPKGTLVFDIELLEVAHR